MRRLQLTHVIFEFWRSALTRARFAKSSRPLTLDRSWDSQVKKHFLIQTLCISIGLVAIGVAISQWFQMKKMTARAEATIVELLQGRNCGNAAPLFDLSAEDHCARITFLAPDGKPTNAFASIITGRGKHRPILNPGQTLPIVFDPGRPEKPEFLWKQSQRRKDPFFLIVLGIFAIFFRSQFFKR